MGATGDSILRRVGRLLRDYPASVLSVNALNADSTQTSITFDTGEGAKLREGMILESDDWGQNNGVEPILIRSVTGDTATVRRAYQNTSFLFAHQANTFFRVAPRFSWNRIYDAVVEVVTGELWPQVWIPRNTTVAWQATNEWFPVGVNDFEEVILAYQLVSGVKYELHAEFMPPEIADDTNFPNGALVIRRTVDTSTIYVAYKARPAQPLGSATNNTNQIDSLIVLGAAGFLQQEEEVPHLAPGRALIEQRIAGPEKLQAGAAILGQFEKRRQQEHLNLEAEIGQMLQYVRRPDLAVGPTYGGRW